MGFVGEPLGSLAAARGVAVILEEREPGQGEPWYAPIAQGGMILLNRTWADANPQAASAWFSSRCSSSATTVPSSPIIRSANRLAPSLRA